MATDRWISKGEVTRLDALEEAIERLAPLVLKFAQMKAAEFKSDPSPSDVPQDADHEEQVRREMARLGRKFHGTRTALRRAAEVLVKSRRKGMLDGASLYATGPEDEVGPRVDGQLLKPHKKGPRLT